MMRYGFDPCAALVYDILRKPHDHEWTLQGFGMLRTYLPGDVRLHVWDDRYAVPNVSLIHDHPWDFTSYVVAGMLRNQRFTPSPTGLPFMQRMIKPGVGLKVLENDIPRALSAGRVEIYPTGKFYHQWASEIHETRAERGTVTMVKRVRGKEDIALVFYPKGGEWVSAEPREATIAEIEDITSTARRLWFCDMEDCNGNAR